ncbi:MAG TPA: hypothetical protein VFJ58_05305 [Armatimonadota bacterium]|nr:hypothetical protein [Armatimonadota bacterium]
MGGPAKQAGLVTVICFVPDPLALLREAQRVLRLAVAVPYDPHRVTKIRTVPGGRS